jgi:hypothetical protein
MTLAITIAQSKLNHNDFTGIRIEPIHKWKAVARRSLSRCGANIHMNPIAFYEIHKQADPGT